MRVFSVVVLLFIATIAHAQVVVTEVMYDPEGADTGHEWIEIENRGSEPVTIEDGKSGWKLFEDGTNHTLTSVRGGITLGVGSFAVITDNTDNFLADHLSFSGMLFDSSFSLKNIGETIAVKNSGGEEETILTYDPTIGANGDGNSLQEKDGVWAAATPTPGAGVPGVGVASVPSQSSLSNGSPERSSSGTPASTDIPTISLRTRDTVALVGAPFIFEPRASESAESAHYQWPFGDGAALAVWGAQPVSHTYYYPGTYSVFLETSEPRLSMKLSVRAVSPAISLTTQGDDTRSSVIIENQGNDEINLEKWQLLANGTTFTLPKIILVPKQFVRFPSEVTRLATPEGIYVELRFPSGVRVPLIENTPPAHEVAVISEKSPARVSKEKAVPIVPRAQEVIPAPEALRSDEYTPTLGPSQEASLLEGTEDRAWQWYTGVALIALLALLGIRFVRARRAPVDEYEIIEDGS